MIKSVFRDVMSNEAVVSFIHNRLQITDNLEDICNQVIDTCLHKVRIPSKLNLWC